MIARRLSRKEEKSSLQACEQKRWSPSMPAKAWERCLLEAYFRILKTMLVGRTPRGISKSSGITGHRLEKLLGFFSLTAALSGPCFLQSEGRVGHWYKLTRKAKFFQQFGGQYQERRLRVKLRP